MFFKVLICFTSLLLGRSVATGSDSNTQQSTRSILESSNSRNDQLATSVDPWNEWLSKSSQHSYGAWRRGWRIEPTYTAVPKALVWRNSWNIGPITKDIYTRTWYKDFSNTKDWDPKSLSLQISPGLWHIGLSDILNNIPVIPSATPVNPFGAWSISLGTPDAHYVQPVIPEPDNSAYLPSVLSSHFTATKNTLSYLHSDSTKPEASVLKNNAETELLNRPEISLTKSTHDYSSDITTSSQPIIENKSETKTNKPDVFEGLIDVNTIIKSPITSEQPKPNESSILVDGPSKNIPNSSTVETVPISGVSTVAVNDPVDITSLET